MQLAPHVVRFFLGSIPVLGDSLTGTIVGLTDDGTALCDALERGESPSSELLERCAELVGYLRAHSMIVDGEAGEPIAQPPAAIATAYLHVTHRCNLQCIGCYSRVPGERCASNLSLEELGRVVSVLRELGVERLVISGGEPLLRDDLPELAAHAKACGVHEVVVLTNGTLVDARRLEALAPSVDVMSVSIDGASSADTAYVRGEQRLGALTAAVTAIQAAGMCAHLLQTVHAKNIETVPRCLKLARSLGASIGFSILSGSRAELGDLFLEDAQLEALVAMMWSSRAQVESSCLDMAENPLRVRVSCGAGRTMVSVAADGTIYPCHMLHKPALALGNALVDDVNTLRNHLDELRLPPVDEMRGCAHCDVRYLCGGGCRARTLRETGFLAARDPYCQFLHRSLEHMIADFTALSGERGGE